MSKRASKRTKRGLEARLREYEALRNPQGYCRPGSLNRKRSGGTAPTGRRK